MLTFTTQQLTGGVRYTNGVKIGNWNEDIARTEVAAQDYESRRARGDLVHITKAREKAFVTQGVPHTFSPDGLVRFGSTVMVSTGGGGSGGSPYYLANLIFNTLQPGHSRVTAGLESQPQARNTWVLNRAPGAPRSPGVPEDNILRYGDRITLECNPSLVADVVTRVAGLPYYLRSSRGSNVLGTSRKGKQEVSVCRTKDSDVEWVVYAGGGDRLMTEGAPVAPGAPLSLLHAMSNVLLCGTDRELYPCEFGAELDVHCATHKGTGQVSASHGGSLPTLPSQPPNVWTLVLGGSPGAGEDRRGIIAMNPATVLESVRGALAATSGLHALRSLFLAFEALDPRGTGALPAEGLKWALYEHGAKLEAAEFTLLTLPFALPPAKPGVTLTRAHTPHTAPTQLSRGALVEALRGGEPLSHTALDLLEEAYTHLTATLGSPIQIGSLKRAYDGKLDARVVAGKLSRAEAKGEFGRQWPHHVKDPNSAVTFEDLCEYYRDVCGVVGEGVLGDLLSNTWHLPGKGWWLQKKGKKVVVTFHKGSSTEAVIPEGQDIPDEDMATLITHLEKLGYGGIARVKVLGLVDPPEE